jgi:hypothetical protein
LFCNRGSLEGAIIALKRYGNWDKNGLNISIYEIVINKLYMSNDSFKYYIVYILYDFVQYSEWQASYHGNWACHVNWACHANWACHVNWACHANWSRSCREDLVVQEDYYCCLNNLLFTVHAIIYVYL